MEDYKQIWDKLSARSRELEEQRTDLENRLSEIQAELAHLNEMLNHLIPLTGVTLEFGAGSVSGLGITDAVRVVLSERPIDRMAPIEIQKKLQEKGFDFSNISQPMASIYKILARLKENDEVQIEKENHRVYYIWNLKEEEIPF